MQDMISEMGKNVEQASQNTIAQVKSSDQVKEMIQSANNHHAIIDEPAITRPSDLPGRSRSPAPR